MSNIRIDQKAVVVWAVTNKLTVPKACLVCMLKSFKVVSPDP